MTILTKVAFVGMTHLGLVSATGVASKGLDVVCVDRDKKLIAELQAGVLPVVEPQLDDLVASNGSRQTFSANFADLKSCDVVYIAPDVPTDENGQSDLSGITALIGEVIEYINETATLVVLCQVPPGFTRQLPFDPALRYYQVETLVFGRAVERATEPERYIVGCDDPSQPLPPAYAEVLATCDCPVLTMRYESAELAKISINMCLVASVGVANTMAELCEQIGADWREIIPALKLDRRIGQFSYLAPGLGIAGGNLERDLATVIRLGDANQTDTGIVQAWLNNSAHARDWALRTIKREVLAKNPEPTVAVLGLAYKENTHSVKNSPSIATISQLPECRIRAHDPVVPKSAANHAKIEGGEDALSTVEGADVLMILTPWPEYRDIKPADIADRLSGNLVIDPYQVLDPAACRAAGLAYFTLGVAGGQAVA